LKVYHAWKLKNKKEKNPSVTNNQNNDMDEERAPKDILNNGNSMIDIIKDLHPFFSLSSTISCIERRCG